VGTGSKEYRVVIPQEDCALIEFVQDGNPGVMTVNGALKDFEPKIVFSWHLSVMLNFKNLIDNGMPSKAEREVVDPYGDQLDAAFKGADPEKPNALFLARITWNKTKELIYRVCEPKPIHNYLQAVIKEKSWPRTFDYRIDPDPKWKLAEWHLNTLNAKK
jgi:hypothetical protein